MAKLRFCKHCRQQFESRRSNHFYCKPSCRTKASYERNNYRYVPGHYQKQTEDENSSPPNKISSVTTKTKSAKKNDICLSSVSNAAIGTAAADTISYGLKRLIAPNALPATKGDLKLLTEQLLSRYHLVKNLPLNGNGESPYFDITSKNIVYRK